MLKRDFIEQYYYYNFTIKRNMFWKTYKINTYTKFSISSKSLSTLFQVSFMSLSSLFQKETCIV